MMFLLFIIGTVLFILATYGVLLLLNRFTGHPLLDDDPSDPDRWLWMDPPPTLDHARLYEGARCDQCGGDHYQGVGYQDVEGRGR